jgi:hypothetical protein
MLAPSAEQPIEKSELVELIIAQEKQRAASQFSYTERLLNDYRFWLLDLKGLYPGLSYGMHDEDGAHDFIDFLDNQAEMGDIEDGSQAIEFGNSDDFSESFDDEDEDMEAGEGGDNTWVIAYSNEV